MPNRTIYVSDDDQPLYQRAQELAGGSLSAAITTALRRYVEIEEGRGEGYKEITVQVGQGGARRKQRFVGMLLGQWGRSVGKRFEEYRVYRTRRDKFVLYVDRSPEWLHEVDYPDSRFAGVRRFFGVGEQTWGFVEGVATLEVVDSLEALLLKVPDEFYEMLAALAGPTAVEDLDI